ncbi:MAG: prephenate dehydrogenase [Nitrospinaceae bacterium]
MTTRYERMTIIGVGLLGGSLARAVRTRNLAASITGCGRQQKTLERARAAGVIDAWSLDIREAVRDADLVVLCSPVGSFIPRVREMKAALKPGCHVTDVGSVKGPLVAVVESLMPPGVHYVGSHPMAGGEKSGFAASYKELFENAKCWVTPTPGTDPEALEKVTGLWSALGMEVERIDPEEHDRIVAGVSHLPHVAAYALMNVVAAVKTPGREDVLEYSAGGLRDSTRLAAADPVMWRDICLFNRDQVLPLIDQYLKALGALRELIQQGDGERLEKTFAAANQHRRRLARTCE